MQSLWMLVAALLVAVRLDWLIGNEQLPALAWSGIALIVASGVLAAYATARRGDATPASGRR